MKIPKLLCSFYIFFNPLLVAFFIGIYQRVYKTCLLLGRGILEILLLFNPSLKGEGMKTIVVGDMHQKQHPILPIVDNAIRFLGARRVVLLGDYCDDYSPNRDTTDAKKLLEGLELQTDWINRTRGRGIQVDALLGNHDMQYLIERQGPGTNLNCIIPAQRLLAQMNVRMAAAVDGWLATHAGLT